MRESKLLIVSKKQLFFYFFYWIQSSALEALEWTLGRTYCASNEVTNHNST